ncbi:MAG: aldo/keto reductase, partial [Synergistaceae bacterium]|nr:aldo/keto reductase [Synergistaceae bacterium]
MPPFMLSNGLRFPAIGFGTYKAAPEDDVTIIRLAIESGYRYFDSASFYGTESVIAEAIRQSGIPRSDFFIASKLWKTD